MKIELNKRFEAHPSTLQGKLAAAEATTLRHMLGSLTVLVGGALPAMAGEQATGPAAPVWVWAAPLVTAVIPAASGLVGVWVGGWLSGRHHRAERRHTTIREQLDKFYSPMVAIRAEIRARSETRLKVHSLTNEVWQKTVDRLEGQPDQQIALEQQRDPEHEALIAYDNKQLLETLVPLYREMLACFRRGMWLVEPSTRAHFATLVEFVDIWERHLAHVLPHGVGSRLDHREERLYPLYDDLETTLDRLRGELKS